jgi:hypothetical protein
VVSFLYKGMKENDRNEKEKKKNTKEKRVVKCLDARMYQVKLE